MDATQYLSIEFHAHCNLGHVHALCPNRNPHRYASLPKDRKLDDETILRIVAEMYQAHGFRGLVAWHYYNEPLVETERMFALMDRIKAAVPQSRFCLWTNGTLIPEDCSRFAAFEQIHVTDYGRQGHPPRNLDKLAAVRQIHKIRGSLDARAADRRQLGWGRCLRAWTEFVIDSFGNVHLCCFDWRGRASPGNVFQEPLSAIVARFREFRRRISGARMSPDAPDGCRYCALRTPHLTRFDEEAARRAERTIAQLPPPGAPAASECPAVVFVFWRNPESRNPMPLQRLTDHLKWNHAYYRHASVFIVTDQDYDVPCYAQCLVYPLENMPRRGGKLCFSLAATKNFGIAAARECGGNPIIVTDPDIAWTASAWQQAANVSANRASVPVYWMATTFEGRQIRCATPNSLAHAGTCRASHEDRGATGTIALTADNWGWVRYDERAVGYGSEDGIIKRDMERLGIRLLRDEAVYHIAHDASKPQVNFSPGEGFQRQDTWDVEFNPINFAENKRLYDRR